MFSLPIQRKDHPAHGLKQCFLPDQFATAILFVGFQEVVV